MLPLVPLSLPCVGWRGRALFELQKEAVLLPQESGRLHCNFATLSRAGEDLGVRKENQDSALAIREYRSGDEALFGVFDGHGPNGESLVASRVSLVNALPALCWTVASPSMQDSCLLLPSPSRSYLT